MPGPDGWCGVVDTNILIGAYVKDYTPTAFPGVWQFLDHQVQAGRLVLIDAVKREVLHPDGLVDWVQDHANLVVRETEDLDTVERYEQVIGWVKDSSQYTRRAADDFARGADGWLVSLGRVKGTAVVTNEAFNAESRKHVPIPNVCREFDVECVTTTAMFERLGARFLWRRGPA